MAVAAAKNSVVAMALQVAQVVHVPVDFRLHLVEYHRGHRQVSALDRLDRHQRLVDRADAIIDDDDDRKLQRAGEIGVEAIFRQRRIEATCTFDDQARCRPVRRAGIDKVLQVNLPTLEARGAMRCQRRAETKWRYALDAFAFVVGSPQCVRVMRDQFAGSCCLTA